MSWRQRMGLLAENRPYRSLWGARTVSTLGNWVTLTALLLYLETTGASGLQVGILLAARELRHLLGPLTGALADRLGWTFGIVYGPIFIAGGAAALIGGYIVDIISAAGAFIFAGFGVGLVAIIVWLILPRD